MKKTRIMKLLSFILCMVLIAAMALLTTGCNDKDTQSEKTSGTKSETSIATEGESPESAQNTTADDDVLGEGKNQFTFTVVGVDGNEKVFEIKTDKTTVGEALLELEIIAGEDGQYGLYVKTVDGVTLDYDKDGKYWAFYVDGEYAMTGVDSTEIVNGTTYTFKAE